MTLWFNGIFIVRRKDDQEERILTYSNFKMLQIYRLVLFEESKALCCQLAGIKDRLAQ